MRSIDTRVYGYHLFADCYEANPEALNSIETIFNFLDSLPELIGMKKIGPPQLAKFVDEEIAGVTGVVMIVTSHISIHTYALKGCFFLDVFSCQLFDELVVLDYAKSCFGFSSCEKTFLSRGNKFPVSNVHVIKSLDKEI